MGTPDLHRVKLYKLNETGGWDDKGTGAWYPRLVMMVTGQQQLGGSTAVDGWHSNNETGSGTAPTASLHTGVGNYW